MSYLETTEEAAAEGPVADLYEHLNRALGHVPNYGKAFSFRPEVFDAWANLNKSVVSNMDLRRYELVTLAAAVTLQSSYCTLAHGQKLLDLGASSDEVRSLALHPLAAGLSDEEQAVVDYAVKVTRSATSVTQDDIDRLRSFGLTDAEIFDIAAAAAMRCFFSTLLDAVGTLPDAHYHADMPDLAGDLQVGRAIDEVGAG